MQDPTAKENLERIGTLLKERQAQNRVHLRPQEETASDRDLLELELNYQRPQRDTRFFKTHPPGYNVISGLGSFFALIGFLVGMLATVAMLGRGGIAEIVGFIVGLIVAAILGWNLPRAIWRGIGPSGRSALRIFGNLGAGAILIFCFLGSGLLIGGLKVGLGSTPTPEEMDLQLQRQQAQAQAQAQAQTPTPTAVKVGPLSGPDWQVLVDANKKPLKLTLAQARIRCQALGKEWRLARLNDISMVEYKVINPLWRACVFHYDGGGKIHGILEYKESAYGWTSTETVDDLPRHVLCLRGDSVR